MAIFISTVQLMFVRKLLKSWLSQMLLHSQVLYSILQYISFLSKHFLVNYPNHDPNFLNSPLYFGTKVWEEKNLAKVLYEFDYAFTVVTLIKINYVCFWLPVSKSFQISQKQILLFNMHCIQNLLQRLIVVDLEI